MLALLLLLLLLYLPQPPSCTCRYTPTCGKKNWVLSGGERTVPLPPHSPASTRSRLLLPQPLGPTTRIDSPGSRTHACVVRAVMC